MKDSELALLLRGVEEIIPKKEFDKKLGKVNYVHVERENITQLVIYSKKHSFFITIEPEITSDVKSRIAIKIKKIISTLK